MFELANNVLEAIGNTPLVKLNKVVDSSCATVLAKCEFLNPTGSVKDRMALHIINEAEKSGELKPGGVIVENTSGNTGLAVAMVASVKGYRCIFTMPDKMSIEKVNMLKSFGAEVVITPTDVPGDSPQHYVEVAKRIVKETPNAFYVNQYHNKLNTEAHYLSTGKEIWEETGGKFDVYVAGTGTGGTTSGAGRYFKEKNPDIKVVGVDPFGSVHYDLFYSGKIVTPPHVYKVEGIGEDIPCEALDFSSIDEMRQVNDAQCFTMGRRLVREEGLFCGGSSGGNVHVAVEIAKEIGPGKTVVVILPDSGTRYITKHLSDTWMVDNGFLPKSFGLGTVSELLKNARMKPVTGSTADSVSAAIDRMKKHGVSQLPLLDDKETPVAIVHEIDILRGLTGKSITLDSPVVNAANEVSGVVSPEDRIDQVLGIFEKDQAALVVDDNVLVGIVTEIDVIEYISKRNNGGT